MGIWSRTMLIFKTKSRDALNRAENPVQILGYVDEQQQELLRRVKQGLIEVAVSKRQLQQQVEAIACTRKNPCSFLTAAVQIHKC